MLAREEREILKNSLLKQVRPAKPPAQSLFAVTLHCGNPLILRISSINFDNKLHSRERARKMLEHRGLGELDN